ncbi:MAG TPA: hypothetical protein VJ762_11670 [Sphingobium sp.]|nr:hypothetical protein [Sphingobium sp.]
MIRFQPGLLALLCLAGCGSEPAADDVGGVSASEARALNEAAATLDAQAGSARADDAGLNPAAKAAARAERGRTDPAPLDQPAH